jgi:hypothetical protein
MHINIIIYKNLTNIFNTKHTHNNMVNLQKLAEEAPSLPSNSEEYRRLEYSLKMNLRVINGRFTEL